MRARCPKCQQVFVIRNNMGIGPNKLPKHQKWNRSFSSAKRCRGSGKTVKAKTSVAA